MGSEKRERQKLARLEKIEAEERAASGARRKRLVIRTAVAAVVLLGGLGIYSLIAGDDSDESAADDGGSSTTVAANECPPEFTPVTGTSVALSNPDVANEVFERDPPCPEPPPEDTAPDAVQTETVIEGQGEGAVAGQTVVVEYIGRVADGTVFDESWSQGRVLEVTLGQGQVIPGWEEGLIGAKLGERRRMVIGSAKAYGEQGSPPAIPPNAPLAFEVDVVDIRAAAPPADPAAPPADPSATTAPAAPPASG